MKNILKANSYLNLIAIVAAFIAVSYVAQTQMNFIVSKIGEGMSGKILYVFAAIIATVIAPISSIPLIALASELWGWVESAALSVTGWFIGAAIAFELSRSYGQEFIFRIIGKQAEVKLRKIIPKDINVFNLILLRMFVPVDIVSYALGLFSNVNRKEYYLSTAIGIIPFACIFAYFGMMDYKWQAAGFFIVLVIIWISQAVCKKRPTV